MLCHFREDKTNNVTVMNDLTFYATQGYFYILQATNQHVYSIELQTLKTYPQTDAKSYRLLVKDNTMKLHYLGERLKRANWYLPITCFMFVYTTIIVAPVVL